MKGETVYILEGVYKKDSIHYGDSFIIKILHKFEEAKKELNKIKEEPEDKEVEYIIRKVMVDCEEE